MIGRMIGMQPCIHQNAYVCVCTSCHVCLYVCMHACVCTCVFMDTYMWNRMHATLHEPGFLNPVSTLVRTMTERTCGIWDQINGYCLLQVRTHIVADNVR